MQLVMPQTGSAMLGVPQSIWTAFVGVHLLSPLLIH